MIEKKCMICGMNINSKNMAINEYSFLETNEKENIIYCPFCGVNEEYLTEGNKRFEIDRKILDNQTLCILEKAMKLEVFNGEFYEEASKMAKDEKIEKLFKDLSNIEYMHARIHKKLGSFKELPKLHKPDYSRHDNDLLLLKEASNREKHAISFYNNNINLISNSTIKEFINALASVENQHIILAESFTQTTVDKQR